MRTFKQLLLIMMVLLSAYSYADNRVINVATDTWEGTANKDGTGYFFDLLRLVYEPHGIKLNIYHMPYSRAVAKLRAGEVDLLLGTYAGFFNSEWYSKYPVGMDLVDVAISNKLNQSWQGPASLDGQRVVAEFGYSFDKYFDLKANYKEAISVESMVKMLIADRIDALIDYHKHIVPVQKALGAEDLFVIKRSVFKIPFYFVFYDSPQANQYKNLFDNEMKVLIESGKVKEMLSKGIDNTEYYVDDEHHN